MARRGKKRSVHGLEEKDEMVTVGDISVAKTLVSIMGDHHEWRRHHNMYRQLNI